MYHVKRSGDVYSPNAISEKPRDLEEYNPCISKEIPDTVNGCINLSKKERNVHFHR